MAHPNNSYIPSLDGIRAVAVMMVFLSHAGFHHIVPGGLGVTIFFFLSGFLITTLLKKEYEMSGGINLRNFYIRRVYRLFPPLYIVILLSWLLTQTGIFSHTLSTTGVGSQLLQLTNYHIILTGKEGLLPGLGILWSLAVEEHFYLIFPLTFLLLLRAKSTPKTIITFSIICIAVLTWRVIYVSFWGLPDGYPALSTYAYTYYSTETRIDSMLFGCIMAIGFNPTTSTTTIAKWKQNTLIGIGLAALLVSLTYRDSFFRETWRYSLQGLALMPIFYFAIIRPNALIFKPLNTKPIMYLGKISYTFYLSHYIIIYLTDKAFGESNFYRLTLALGFTVIFSSLMYHFIELRFSKLRKKLHN